MNLSELYQEIILEHYKEPHNKGKLSQADVNADGKNPMCGDEIQVFLKIEGNTIKDIRFDGAGCAISQASASVMTDSVKGRTIAEAQTIINAFANMVKKGALDDKIGEDSELAAFQGISAYPTRIKCAMLAWNALKNSIEQF